jgi:hypothetical protein
MFHISKKLLFKGERKMSIFVPDGEKEQRAYMLQLQRRGCTVLRTLFLNKIDEAVEGSFYEDKKTGKKKFIAPARSVMEQLSAINNSLLIAEKEVFKQPYSDLDAICLGALQHGYRVISQEDLERLEGKKGSNR